MRPLSPKLLKSFVFVIINRNSEFIKMVVFASVVSSSKADDVGHTLRNDQENWQNEQKYQHDDVSR